MGANPLPSFRGEPKLVAIPDDIDSFTDLLWSNLNADNKISLFVRFINTGTRGREGLPGPYPLFRCCS